MPLFDTADERKVALVVVAGVAAHALIQKPVSHSDENMDSIIRAAFKFADKFLAEVERRV